MENQDEERLRELANRILQEQDLDTMLALLEQFTQVLDELRVKSFPAEPSA